MVGSRKTSFLRNIIEQTRPDCRNLQRSLIIVNLSEIFLGGMLKVQSAVWVKKHELVKNFFYRYGGREVLIG